MFKVSSVIFVILATVFLSQVYISVKKYLDGDISKSIGISKKPTIHLPAITVCPLPRIKAGSKSLRNDTFSNIDADEKLSNYLWKVQLVVNSFNESILTATEALKQGIIRTTYSVSMTPSYTKQLMHCFTFKEQKYDYKKELVNSEVLVKFVLSQSYTVEYLAWIHPENEFLPIKATMFGIRIFIFGTSGAEPGYSEYIRNSVTSKLVDMISRPEAPCHPPSKPFMAVCIKQYIERQLGCQLPWDWSSSGPNNISRLKICELEDELAKFEVLMDELYPLLDMEIYELTGCTTHCHRVHYKSTSDGSTYVNTTWLMNFKNDSSLKGDYLSIGFATQATQADIEKDVLLYDESNLIADIGGYLGLLLGFSIYSISLTLEQTIKKWIC